MCNGKGRADWGGGGEKGSKFQSFPTLIPDCRMETGKDGSGRELSHRRNWGSTSSEEEVLNLKKIMA